MAAHVYGLNSIAPCDRRLRSVAIGVSSQRGPAGTFGPHLRPGLEQRNPSRWPPARGNAVLS